MSKLEKMKNSLLSSIEIDMQQIEEIKQMPQSQIDFMGGVAEWYATTGCSNYYKEIVQAIKSAEYKYPDSDSVWEKAERVKDEIVREKLSWIAL
ncbi:MAG: hypothetical protein MSL49_05570 [Lactobacillus johnsonii]|nr:hypothetical protein [Lactobacillus johnsonii]MDY3299599.1 hypothetical protein [Limosilactobacillus reuteri]MDY4501929.1 hypothetical protein [Lactobacillus johnsonii]